MQLGHYQEVTSKGTRESKLLQSVVLTVVGNRSRSCIVPMTVEMTPAPGTEFPLDYNQALHGTIYRTQTLGITDIPGLSTCSLVSPGSKVIFTGMRCTTLT